MKTKNVNTRKLVMTSMLSAVAFVLYYLDFNVPLMPSFIKLDFSNVAAMLAGFSMGPISGVIVCFVKDLLHFLLKGLGTTVGTGDLFDFVTGAVLVLSSSFIYRSHKTRKSAICGSIIGAMLMTAVSLPLNYFIIYPLYASFFGGMEAIISAYQAIFNGVGNLFGALCMFNVPFTLIKGLLTSLIVFLIYKPLSPIIKGNRV